MIRKVIVFILLIASAAMAAVWVLSFMHRFSWQNQLQGATGVRCQISNGTLEVLHIQHIGGVKNDQLHSGGFAGFGWGELRTPSTRINLGSEGGFSVRRQTTIGSGVLTEISGNCFRFISFPCWAPMALCLAYPLLVYSRAWQQRRRKPGFCLACGYDLWGNVSGRCPECGLGAAEAGNIGGVEASNT